MQFQKKIDVCTPCKSLEISRGRGILKVKILEVKYEAKLEFLGGRGLQNKKPSMGGVWPIFSATAQSGFGFFNNQLSNKWASKLDLLCLPAHFLRYSQRNKENRMSAHLALNKQVKSTSHHSYKQHCRMTLC